MCRSPVHSNLRRHLYPVSEDEREIKAITPKVAGKMPMKKESLQLYSDSRPSQGQNYALQGSKFPTSSSLATSASRDTCLSGRAQRIGEKGSARMILVFISFVNLTVCRGVHQCISETRYGCAMQDRLPRDSPLKPFQTKCRSSKPSRVAVACDPMTGSATCGGPGATVQSERTKRRWERDRI
jgi:hypothetical protein